MRSNAVALLTDFGLHDWFVGVMKGVVISINPDASIVDISHEIPRQNIVAGSFALAASYSYLPVGSVTAVVVDPGVGTRRRVLCARSAGRLFLAPDNGVLSGLMAREGRAKLVSVENDTYFFKPVSSTFHGRDIFAPVAAHLSLGVHMEDLGPEIGDCLRLEIPSPQTEGDLLAISVQWIDGFGNVITNCPSVLVDEIEARWGGELSIGAGAEAGEAQVDLRDIKIAASYEAVGPGQLLAIRGSSGYLEISVRQGSAAEILGIAIGDKLHLGRKV
jgi:S-adenosylmethionine hydrolase